MRTTKNEVNACANAFIQIGAKSVLDGYTVCFLGHRQVGCSSEIEQKLEKVIRAILLEKDYVEFLVGRNGEFDQLAASTVLRLKRTVRDDNSALVLVLPYVTAEYLCNQTSFENYYDNVEVSEVAANSHFKAALQVRNHEMVDRSNLVVCYVNHKSGGAYRSVEYAQKQRKTVINLAEMMVE